jgi:3-deoxy-D-manno-octulosonic-acid transferase
MASLLRGLGQRLGRLDPEVARLGGRSPLWLHGASVGEVLSAEPLVELLRRDEPGHPPFFTTTTVTGRDTARRRLGVPATLLPLDLPPVVGRVVRRLAPAAVVILETELWPALIRAAAGAGVPVLIVSARLSPGAAARYARVRAFFAGALGQVAEIAAQSEDDARRFVALGARAERVSVQGSLKLARRHTASAGPPPVDLGDRPVLVAASTQPGEEEAVLAACAALWRDHPDLLLVLAPRRPERFAEVTELLDRSGVSWSRRGAGVARVPAGDRVFLLDTVGELASFFPGARGAFVGGTLAPLGGHNLLEPAATGVPVQYGPHVENVREAAALLEGCGAGTRVAGAADLAAVWRALLEDPAAARAAGVRAQAELEARSGVAEEIAARVRRHLRRGG